MAVLCHNPQIVNYKPDLFEGQWRQCEVHVVSSLLLPGKIAYLYPIKLLWNGHQAQVVGLLWAEKLDILDSETEN
jgi:hypothetical protein